jgi:hypothetical protein
LVNLVRWDEARLDVLRSVSAENLRQVSFLGEPRDRGRFRKKPWSKTLFGGGLGRIALGGEPSAGVIFAEGLELEFLSAKVFGQEVTFGGKPSPGVVFGESFEQESPFRGES